MSEATHALDVAGLTYAYSKSPPVFQDATFSVSAGESVALMGPSGVGKTTLLSLVLGLIVPARGTVSVSGRAWSDMSAAERARHRATRIGMVFQFGELIDELTPQENIALPLLWSGHEGVDAMSRAAALLDRLGVQTAASTSDVVSGGERQRIAVARALIADPPVILADEPTGSLDTDNAAVLADLLFSLPSDRDCALLVVTHSRDVAERADRVLQLTPSGIVERASWA
ncbi:ABC transporter ATP-binding protein [Janibacter anophelis]|uniref:ABC transporter ATP-binding protein n=1 Tax=Janibacter anophelis TaxID=319054 RepID=UPI000832F983|nr:ABC transporter ATP-binding protein [Janibacter anophelis]